MTSSNSVDRKLKQETAVLKGPLNSKRSHVDSPFFVAFSTFITVWIAIAIYGFCIGDKYAVYYQMQYFFSCFMKIHWVLPIMYTLYIFPNIYSSRYFILGYLLFSTTILSVFIALYRWATKVLVWITIVLTSLLLILVYCLIGYCVYRQVFGPIIVLPFIIIAIIYGMIISSFTKIGMKIVCQVIHESCKAMFFFPSILLFIVIQFILHLLVVGFSLSIFLHLNTIRDVYVNASTNETDIEDFSYSKWEEQDFSVPYYIYFFQTVNICGLLWASSFIVGSGRMILTATFATWFHVKDKRSVPALTLLKCTAMVVRYHLGTVAYASSLFSIIPMFFIIWKYTCDRLKEMCKRPTSILSWLTMLMKFSFDALAMSAVHGRGFYKSAKDSYILMMKHPLSFLAINAVSESVIFLGTFLITAVPFMITLVYVLIFDDVILSPVHVTALLISTMISLIVSLTFFMLFRAASNTIRFLYFEESKFSQESEIDLYEIHTDLTIKETATA